MDEKLTCPNVAAKLEFKAKTSVDIDTNYGFTLIATLNNLTPDLSNSHLYLHNRGKVDARFTVEAAVTAPFDTGELQLLDAHKFGAAFAVPGIITIGPNFKVGGRVEGDATLGVNLESKVALAA